jgi:nitrite reductase/ring-hydroxylating ferredoxin subunit
MADDRRELEGSERLDRYLEALLGDGRPSPDDVADVDEAEMARMAAEIAGAVSEGAGQPDRAFVDQLRLRMRAADQGIHAVQTPPPVRREVTPAGSRTVRLTRRQLLTAAMGTAAGLAAGVAGGFALRSALDDDVPGWPQAELVTGEGIWQQVSTVAALQEGEVLAFSTSAFSGFLLNDGGEIRALSSACTHLGCTLVYRPDFADLRCPCHPASFNLRGWLANGRESWRAEGPYPGDEEAYPVELPPLARPKVKVTDGRIFVWTART